MLVYDFTISVVYNGELPRSAPGSIGSPYNQKLGQYS